MKLTHFTILLSLFYVTNSYCAPTPYNSPCNTSKDDNCYINLSTSSASSKQRKVGASSSIKIQDDSGYCKIATNTSGSAIFIPLNTVSERTANLSGTPGITYSDC